MADCSGPSSQSGFLCGQSERTGLSLAAPGGTAIGCSAGRRTCGSTVRQNGSGAGGREAPAGFTNSGDLLILHLNQGAGCPAATLGHRLLVCSEVEPDEEEQVRGDDDHSGDSSKLLTCALAHVGHVGSVGAGEVGP